VIGAGSGGVRAARVAASLGARVAVVERGRLGGTCVNVGCVPKKLLVYGSAVARELSDARGYGWTVGEAHCDWPVLIARKDAEIARLNGIYAGLLQDAGVDVIGGTASLANRYRVEVEGRQLTADHILIATGSRAFVPSFEGCEHVITSDQAFYLEALPKSIVVVGGGYIAVEFASIFNAFGVAVTLVHRGDQILRGFDPDVRTHLAGELSKAGIELCLGLEVVRVELDQGHKCVELGDGRRLEAAEVMFATGRVPNTQGLGLSEVGVSLGERGEVVVDAHGRSSAENIYAVGDVIDRINLTPVAIAQGQAVAQTLFGGEAVAVDHEGVPSAVFSQPPAGAVGLTEPEAQERHRAVDVYRSVYRPMKHTLSGRDERAMMKLVVDRDTQRVLGVHMVGPEAGEIIQGFAVALKCGATKAQLDATVGIHPTAAEEFVTMRHPVRSSPAF